MWVARVLVFFTLSLVLSVSTKLGSSECICTGYELDCSFRMKTLILESDLESDSKSEVCSRWKEKWNFRGNYLRNLRRILTSKLDISMNEFGLVLNSSLDIGSLTELDVSNNYINSQGIIGFPTYSCNLIVLNISNNDITDLGDIGQNCRLEILRIANNKLTQLNNYSFTEKLKFLDLSGNPLRSVSPAAFDGLGKLETLDLSDTKRLSVLPNETFLGSLNLKHLFLNGNKLTNLPSGIFAPLEILETLHLQRNGIKHLPSGIFNKLLLLRVLNLDSNALQELPAHLFRRLHSLEHLSVRRNHLTTLPSLHLCSGPLRVVVFSENDISSVNESAVRALWRPGFKIGDLGNNPIHEEAFAWAQSSSDVSFRGKDPYNDYYTIRFRVEDRGVITDCVGCSLSSDNGMKLLY